MDAEKEKIKKKIKGGTRNMEDVKEEAIKNFVCKNYSEEIPKKMVEYFLKRSIGPNKDGLVAVLDGEEFLIINEEGNIIGPS